MKKELKEKATKCKDFVREHAVGIGIGAGACVISSIIGLTLFKNKKDGEAIVEAFNDVIEYHKPSHCVEFEKTTLGTALDAIEETFKDVDRDTEVFALVYDDITW